MIRVRDVIHAIDRFAPFGWSCEWDNAGLQAGSPEWEVNKVGVSLDATGRAIEEAVDEGCSCLVVHHPLIFEPLRSIRTQTPLGGKLLKAMENRLAVVAAHTNWDVSPLGVNRILGEELGLLETSPLEESNDGSWGMGLSGVLRDAMTDEEFRENLRERWALTWIREYNIPKTFFRVAIAGGSGGDLWQAALFKRAEVFITADMKYHQIMEAVESGLGVVLADHGEMERKSVPSLARLLSENLPLEVINVDLPGFDPGYVTIPIGRRGEIG
ncbi:MAG: Nif3-like dinuclear metal center hexameric protein [Thermovirgaceae bacterium]|nr:Nif3-like dinuclear metal center hexameric protein [Thermovirgaceae bacterium]